MEGKNPTLSQARARLRREELECGAKCLIELDCIGFFFVIFRMIACTSE